MIFGTDGIRAQAGTPPLDAKTITKLSAVVRKQLGSHARIVCGRDTRTTGTQLLDWMCSAFSGWDIYDLGVVPTPVVAFETKARRADLGIVATASHNPHQYNGLKFFDRHGLKLSRDRAQAWSDAVAVVESDGFEAAADRLEATPESYLDFICRRFRPDDFEGLRVAFDCANGACTLLASRLSSMLNMQVAFIGDAPDGCNINDGVGSLHPEALAHLVKDQNLDAGFAFDGDGDRVLAVDGNGHIVHGDVLLFVLKTCYQLEGRPLGDVVGTIMCGFGLEQALSREGITLHRTQVGDQNVLAMMQKQGFLLGGEPSGHLIQADLFPAGDGLLAALRVARHLAHQRDLFDVAAERVALLPSMERAYLVRHKPRLESIPQLVACRQQLARKLKGHGRLVLRYSGTEPKLGLWIESDQLDDLDPEIDELERAIAEVLA